MSEIASASINTFGPSPKADFVSPSEQLITLTYGQLQELIINAVTKAIEPLQDEVRELKATVANQDEKIAFLESTQNTQTDNQLIQLRLISQLREATKKVPGKTEISRAEKIEKYLSSRPDHRATFETLKGHLGIDKDLLNDAINTLMNSAPGRYGITRTPGDKRKRTLIMLPK
jgi:hypothetical protein